MPVEMKLWRLNGSKLHEMATTAPDTEGELEDWIVADSSLLAEDLLIIGRQLGEQHGGILDLLAIDTAGDLVVIELKKHRTPREVVTQALQYASWVRALSWDEVSAIAAQHLDRSLEEVFKETFEEELPETVNSNHRIMIVAAEMDPVTETIVTYLAEEGNLDINVVFFRCFKHEKELLVGRSWLMDPETVERRTGTGPRRPPPSLPELREMAVQAGVVKLHDEAVKAFSELTRLYVRRNAVAFCAYKADGGTSAIITVYPGYSSPENGLYVDIRLDAIAEHMDVSEEQVREALPESSGKAQYGDKYYLKSEDEIKRFAAALRSDE